VVGQRRQPRDGLAERVAQRGAGPLPAPPRGVSRRNTHAASSRPHGVDETLKHAWRSRASSIEGLGLALALEGQAGGDGACIAAVREEEEHEH
jgi:hypothetical protein